MELKKFSSCLLLMMFLCCLSSSQAYKFYVGGKDGWVVTPTENYSHWAERNRFQVNDTLYFKYKKGSNTVLVVNKDDYYSCNTKGPLKSLTEGDSIFHFDHSGPHYFISGNVDSCKEGQKLIVVVMAVRNKTHHHVPPSPSPAAGSPPPSPSPASTPAMPPPVESPKSTSTDAPASIPVEAPKSSDQVPSDAEAPAPAPHKSGSGCLGCSLGSVMGYSVGVGVVLCSILVIV